MAPLRVAPVEALRRRRRLRRIALEPFLHDVVVVLLRPQQPGQALAHDRPGVLGQVGRDDGGVELVGFALARRHRVVEPGERRRHVEALGTLRREAQADADAPAGGHGQRVVGGRLGAGAGRVHGAGASVHDRLADAILGVERTGDPEQAHRIGLVVREEQRRLALGVEPAPAVAHRLGGDGGAALDGWARLQASAPAAPAPRPGVAEPDRRQHADRRRLGPAVGHRDLHQQIFAVDLGVLDEHVEVAIAVEDAGVDQLVLGDRAVAAPILVDQVAVRERRLWILVEHPHEGVRRRRVEVEVVLLDVLAVVALVAGQAEQPLLQDRVAAVPQREAETDLLVTVADCRQAVLVPAVGARPGLIVRQVVPRLAVRAVVLTDRAPAPVADVGAPSLPVGGAGAGVFEPAVFGGHRPLPAVGAGPVTLTV